jgi:hypothetical protein
MAKGKKFVNSFLLRKFRNKDILHPMFFSFAEFSLRKMQENQAQLYCLTYMTIGFTVQYCKCRTQKHITNIRR